MSTGLRFRPRLVTPVPLAGHDNEDDIELYIGNFFKAFPNLGS